MAEIITREQLKAKMDWREDFTLVETLPPSSYREVHLPGALLMPLDLVEPLAPELLPDKQAQVVLYCASFT
jgi:rhodanese-related sulfurtransferase